MNASTSNLTARQEKALAALLTEVTLDSAAKKAGISDVTMWRWLQTPEFRTRFQDARRQVVEDAIALLQRASKRAVATLARNLDCGSPGAEVRAAQLILELGMKGVELLELESRIVILEQNLPTQEEGRPGR